MGWTRFLRRARWDDERARELESYLEIETDANLARGMTPADARAAAHRKLDNVTLVREEIYRMNSLTFVETLWQDLRYGARLLRLNPGFALVALLSLALGIGANTAIFQAVDAVRLRTLPVKDPNGLVAVRIGVAKGGRTGSFTGNYPRLTYAQWQEIRASQQAFASLFAWGTTEFNLAEGGESRFARGLWVSGDYFSTLGVQPAVGRLLTSADDDPRACDPPAAVISYPFWQAEFGGDASAVGRALRLDGHLVTIAGVAPRGFFGLDVGRSFDVAVPLCAQAAIRPGERALDRRDVWWLAAFGRLKPGWTIDRATAHLTALSPGIFEATVPPTYRPQDVKGYLAFQLQAFPASTGVSSLRTEYGTSLWLLLSIAGLVLLIACANLANLMLARASARGREIAIRLAIGASRTRIVRQLMAESLLLTGLGAAAGVWLAQWLSRALVAFIATDQEQVFVALHLDWRVLAFTVGLAVVTCVIFGLTPALRATRTSPATMVRAMGPGLTEGRDRLSLRRALVVTQMAVSMVLVVGALLFARTFHNLATLDPGFRQDVLVATLDLRRTGVPDAQVAALHRRILERLRALPDTAAAGSADVVPIGRSFWNQTLVVDGVTQQDFPLLNRVSAGFFETMGVGFVAGRNFDGRDTLAAPRVAVVDEAFVRKYFGGKVPLGRTFQFAVGPGEPNPSYEIVGVVKNTKYADLRDPFEPIIYLASTQDPDPGSLTVLLHARNDTARLVAPVTQAVAGIDPRILINFQMLDAQIRDSLVRERLMAALSGFFATLAVLLAMVGLYGVMSYSVARRRTEIGIRLALGAGRGRIARLIVRETAWLVAVGLALAIAAGHAAASLLYGVTPGDAATLAVAVVALGAVALAASLLPARRAARLDPTAALREQ